ncbi:MAG: hypothetical protein ACXWC9_07300, partial [Pseudobdellovibrionaceae bacterium]
SFSISEPLLETLPLMEGLSLEKGQQAFSFEVTPKNLAPVLSKVTLIPSVQDLKIEEANFEDIIHRFLEKESRILSPGHSHKS